MQQFFKTDNKKQASSSFLIPASLPQPLLVYIDRRGGFRSMPTSGKPDMGRRRSGRWGRSKLSMENRPRKRGRQRRMAMKCHFSWPEGSKASNPAVAGSGVGWRRRPQPRKSRPSWWWCFVLVDFVVFWFWARGEVKNRWSSYDDITRIELREMKLFFNNSK